MTDAEASELAQRLERMEGQIRELRALLAQREAARAVHEPPEPYAAKLEIPTAHPHIVHIPGVQGGEPIVRGAYKTVWGIVELFQQGCTPEQIVEDKGAPLTLAQVYDALSYYYDNQGAIDSVLARQNAAVSSSLPVHPQKIG